MNYYTPDNISELGDGEIFVFGSNRDGDHAGGAARTGVELFGAVQGQGEGLQGRSYAIPTMGGWDELEQAVGRFIIYATEHPELLFYVTKIGTGIAGLDEKKVKALWPLTLPGNVRLPKKWDDRRYKFLLSNKSDQPTSAHGDMIWEQGHWQTVKGEIVACSNGLHCSFRAIDALSYVKGGFIARTEVKGKVAAENDKEAWESMRLVDIRQWRKEDSVALAIYAAELVIGLYEKQYPDDDRPRKAIEAAKHWLDNPTAADAAARAADAAARAAYATARAAYATARAAYAAAYAALLDDISMWIERRFDSLPKYEVKS